MKAISLSRMFSGREKRLNQVTFALLQVTGASPEKTINPSPRRSHQQRSGPFIRAILGKLNAPKTITGFINDYTIMPAQLVQDVDERVYRTFRDRCSDLNIDLGKAVTDALDMWLERSDYDEAFMERQRKILREEEFVSLDEI